MVLRGYRYDDMVKMFERALLCSICMIEEGRTVTIRLAALFFCANSLSGFVRAFLLEVYYGFF